MGGGLNADAPHRGLEARIVAKTQSAADGTRIGARAGWRKWSFSQGLIAQVWRRAGLQHIALGYMRPMIQLRAGGRTCWDCSEPA